MKALVKFCNNYQLKLVSDPTLESHDDVLVKIKTSAICRTDQYVAQGLIDCEDNRVLGHEASGTVISIGNEVNSISIDDQVIINPMKACYRCDDCLKQDYHHCSNIQFMGVDYDGTFAEYVVCPANQVYRFSDLSFEQAAYTEPIAATLAVVYSSIHDHKEASIAVVGSGRIAQLTFQILARSGYTNVQLIGLENLQKQTSEGAKFDYVVESISTPNTATEDLFSCIRLLRTAGTLILKSRNPHPVQFPTMELIKRRITIESVYYAPFDEAIHFIENNLDLIDSLIGRSYPIEDHALAFHTANQSEANKTFFIFK